MAGTPSLRQILESRSGKAPASKALAARIPDNLIWGGSRKQTAFEMLDPSEWMAQKSVAFNRYQMDFINDVGVGMQPYSERQLENAYYSSVFLFAAIRRVANLISRARIVAQVKQGDKWQPAPEAMLLNRVFADEGAHLQSRMYLNYAVYGMAAAYKKKTRKAVIEEARGEPIYDYIEGAVSGLHVLDKPFFEPDEDVTGTDLKGLFVQADSEFLKGRSHLMRDEFVYFTDWNPRHYHRGRSLVSVAIHEAVTNGAIARWASEYFTRGALPMLLVSLANDDVNEMTPADLMTMKRKFEQQMTGGVETSLRTSFMDRQVKVDQVGIAAAEVAAPDLNKTALEGISATVGIERDLIVAPEGGTQERHEQMLMQAWTDTVIPFFELHLLPALNEDLGLGEKIRLVLDVSHISELDARRSDKATTEKDLYMGGMQRMGEGRKKLNMPPDPDFNDWFWDGVNQRPISAEKIKLLDAVTDEKIATQVMSAWDGFLIKRSKAVKMIFGEDLEAGEKDGYKFEVTPQEQGQAFAALRSWLEQSKSGIELEHAVNGKPTLDTVTNLSRPPIAANTIAVEVDATNPAEPAKAGQLVPVAQGAQTPATLETPPPAQSAVVAGSENWMSLWMPNDPALVDIQNQLKAMYPLLDYEDPAHFHVTLVYAPFVTNVDLEGVKRLLPKSVEGFELWAGPVTQWTSDTDDKEIVFLSVENSALLAGLQARLAQAYQAYGQELSEYSVAGAFKPHVTLARLPQGHAPVSMNVRAILRPQCVVLQQGDYQTTHTIPFVVPPPSPQPPIPPGLPDKTPAEMEAELTNVMLERRRNQMLIARWQKTGKPPEALATRIVQAVTECLTNPRVWEAAGRAIQNGWLDESACPDENPICWYLKGTAEQETPQDELLAWEKATMKNINKGRRFEVKSLSPDMETEIRGVLLDVSRHDSDKISGIFKKAHKALEDDPPGAVAEDALNAWVEQIEQSGDSELLKLIQENSDARAEDSPPEGESGTGA